MCLLATEMVFVGEADASHFRGKSIWEDIDGGQCIRIQRQKLSMMSVSSVEKDAKGRRYPFRLITCGSPKLVLAVAKTRTEIQRDNDFILSEIRKRGLLALSSHK